MVILVLRVGYLYITHPFATDVRAHPLDLHVLGMPPAFILSQDQTLKKVYPTPPVLFSFQRPYFLRSVEILYQTFLILSIRNGVFQRNL